MDPHDLGANPASPSYASYDEALRVRKQILLDARSHAGQRPQPRKSRVETITEFKLLQAMVTAAITGGVPKIANGSSSFAPSPYAPCVRRLRDLNKIMMDDLLVETHHRGSYLLLRAVTPQTRMIALLAVVEDENGDVFHLQVYHQEGEKGGEAEDVIAEGQVMIIKEPYLQMGSRGNFVLRVDHLGDIVFLPADDARIPSGWQRPSGVKENTAMAWKTRGNDHFAKANFRAAIQSYTRALACSPTEEEARTIRLNRSLAFIKTKQFDAALSDVESATATATGKPAEKALFRKAQALYGLQKFRECCEALEALRLEYPNNTAAQDLLDRAIKRLVEQECGEYSFKQLHAEAATLRPPLLDHATYIGPVEVRSAGSRGRGLFTTKAVKAGDLLLCEKAFAYVLVDTERGEARSYDFSNSIDDDADPPVMSTHPDLINGVLQKLFRNPSLIPTITDLHHGSYESVETFQVDGTPVLDTFLVRRIAWLNSFGCELSPLTSHLEPSASQSPLSTAAEARKDAFNGIGLWPTASYVNHSCFDNAYRSFIGDMMILRAAQDLPPGTEIRFLYDTPDPTSGYRQRQHKLRYWGFTCDCALCQDDKEAGEAVVMERKRLRARFDNDINGALGRSAIAAATAATTADATAAAAAAAAAITKGEAIVTDMLATYKRPAREAPRLAVWDLQFDLAQACWLSGEPSRAVELALRALASLGFEIDGGSVTAAGTATVVVRRWGLVLDGVIACWILLRDAYRWLEPGLAAPAEEYARVAYRICYGEDETFDERHGNRN